MNKCISCGEPLDSPSGDGCAAMTKHRENVMDYKTGQIYGWNGGECTVHPKTVVQVWLRSGGVKAANAQVLVWDHNQNGHDIVCFQVITPYAGPKTIWVNEYESGCGATYTSEEQAKSLAYRYHTRIAVEYVEKQK